MNPAEQALRIVVVGGVAGGASAAARARRVNAQAEITVLEKGSNVSFANCGMPYHLGGEIEDRDQLLVASPELFWNRFRIRVRTGHEVLSVDRNACTVTGQTDDGKEFKVPYDRLILATGSEPFRPQFWDSKIENCFQLWTLDDMDRILAYMNRRPCRTATVIGAGFVGLEVVEQLVRRSMTVNLIERLPQVLGVVDPEIASCAERELAKQGVQLHLGVSVESLLTSNSCATATKLSNQDSVTNDLVIVGVGVRPRTELAVSAELRIGSTGGVEINEFCQTSDPKIYAVGDMVEYRHGTQERNQRIPLAGPANRAGRIAGCHAAGGVARPLGAMQSTSIVRVFGLGLGTTGMTEKDCLEAGIEYRCATIRAAHHASYFPGAKTMILKIVYAPSGRLLGAQAAGALGVDKRIDVAASVLHFRGTVHDLADLDLAYAPPYGAAKDPLHMAAFLAQNDLAGLPRLLPHNADLQNMQVVDVRTKTEIDKLPFAGAVHIALDELAERWEELDPTRPTVTLCHSGKRAHVAACWLRGQGFQQVMNLNGGVSLRASNS